MTAPEDRRDDLLVYAKASPGGFTVDDVQAWAGWTYCQTKRAIRDLRIWLGAHDTMNLPCVPAGAGQRWTYRLVANLDGSREWTANRLGDAQSRLRTIHAMAASITAGTNGRTLEGRKARVIETAVRHLVEDLELMAAP